MRKRQKLKRVQKSCIGRGIITITLHAQSSPYLFHSVPLCIQADTHTYIPCLWIQPGKLHCCSTCWRNTCSDAKIYVALFFFKIRRGGEGKEFSYNDLYYSYNNFPSPIPPLIGIFPLATLLATIESHSVPHGNNVMPKNSWPSPPLLLNGP